MTRQAHYRNVTPALVIGIGYPSHDVAVSTTRRWPDLTPSVSSDPNERRKTGGGDEFLRVIDEEVKPLVAARYKVDATRQALWGHSIGGLTVLRALFLRTDSFSTFLVSSPSIWWEGQMVLRLRWRIARTFALECLAASKVRAVLLRLCHIPKLGLPPQHCTI